MFNIPNDMSTLQFKHDSQKKKKRSTWDSLSLTFIGNTCLCSKSLPINNTTIKSMQQGSLVRLYLPIIVYFYAGYSH